MNIIFDTENIDAIKNNNVVLELDTFYSSQSDKTATAYCVVNNIKITDFNKIEHNQRLHAELISAYKQKDFKLCQDLLEHLIGAFDGEVDSFYLEIQNRIENLNVNDLPSNWSNIIKK